MKKNVKTLIIAAVAAVLLTGLMLFLIFMPKGGSDDESATFDEGVAMEVSTDKNGIHQAVILTNDKGEIDNNSYGTLIDYVPAQISTIHVENKSGTLDIKSYTPVNDNGESEATQYTLIGYEDFDLQTGIADEIANDAAKIEFSKVMTLEKSKSSDFGVDKPRATVTVTYTDKTKSVIAVGNDAPQGAGTYIKFGDNDTVYLVETDAVSSFDYGVTDMISLEINSSADNNDNNAASSITISGSNFAKDIVLKPNTNTNISASYAMVSPVEYYANENESSLVDGAIRGLYAESVRMVNPADTQLESLGLKAPYARIRAVYPDESIDLIASKPDSQGKVNIMKNGGKVVYVMSSSNLPWVLTSYEKLVNEYVLYPKMGSLTNVSVNDGSKTYDFTLATKQVTDDSGEGVTSTTTVKYGSEEIDNGYFTTFFLNTAMVELADADSKSASGSPVFSVKYTYEDGAADTVAFYKADSSRYIAALNGKSVGHSFQAKINKLVKQVSLVAQNQEVESL